MPTSKLKNFTNTMGTYLKQYGIHPFLNVKFANYKHLWFFYELYEFWCGSFLFHWYPFFPYHELLRGVFKQIFL